MLHLTRSRSDIHRQDVGLLQFLRAALIQNVEVTDGCDLVAPELDTDRIRRAKAEQINESAAHGIFTNGFNEWRSLESHRIKTFGQFERANRVAGSERKPQIGESGGNLGALLQCARSRRSE